MTRPFSICGGPSSFSPISPPQFMIWHLPWKPLVQTEEAVATYRKLIESTPNYRARLRAGLQPACAARRRGSCRRALAPRQSTNAAYRRNRQCTRLVPGHFADEEIRNGNEAVNLLEPAKKAGQKLDAATLDTLAAAYAEVGRFDDAVATADEAMELARQANDEPLAARILARRSLYERRQPFRER